MCVLYMNMIAVSALIAIYGYMYEYCYCHYSDSILYIYIYIHILMIPCLTLPYVCIWFFPMRNSIIHARLCRWGSLFYIEFHVCIHAHCSIPDPMYIHVYRAPYCLGPSRYGFIFLLTWSILSIKLLEQGFSNRKRASLFTKRKRQVNFLPVTSCYFIYMLISRISTYRKLKRPNAKRKLLPREKTSIF